MPETGRASVMFFVTQGVSSTIMKVNRKMTGTGKGG